MVWLYSILKTVTVAVAKAFYKNIKENQIFRRTLFLPNDRYAKID
jgi:hypothetical protein